MGKTLLKYIFVAILLLSNSNLFGQEEEPQKKGEKIDPKKLVIYSEIMKPKF